MITVRKHYARFTSIQHCTDFIIYSTVYDKLSTDNIVDNNGFT